MTANLIHGGSCAEVIFNAAFRKARRVFNRFEPHPHAYRSVAKNDRDRLQQTMQGGPAEALAGCRRARPVCRGSATAVIGLLTGGLRHL